VIFFRLDEATSIELVLLVSEARGAGRGQPQRDLGTDDSP
jgi:hypothetical protein